MYDLKIRGGLIYDGSGAEPVHGDLALRDGEIVAVGACPDHATREMNAEGLAVTPGFIDLHTHYDGQVSWDEELAPSSVHGVTTALMGNCGVGFAPARAKDREALIHLMEGVEDIPGSALSEGIEWSWESFPEYLETLDRRAHTIDLAAQVPHDALRVYVMGERALAREAATEADIEAMRLTLREALEAGAMGFSTGRSDNHRAADGSHTPAADAEAAELSGISRAFQGLQSGVLQAVSDFDITEGRQRFEPEMAILEAMIDASGGRPMSLSLLERIRDVNQWKRIIESAESLETRGKTLRLQVAARGIGVLLGLEATFHPFMGFPSYVKIAHLPLAERVRVMRQPDFKAQILSEKSGPVAGDGSPIPPLADQLLANLDFVAMKLFRFDERFDYEPKGERSLLAEAMRRGVKPLEQVYDAILEDDGRSLLYFPIYNYQRMDLSAVHEMLSHPLALAGLSDGGAHVGTICDASFPTYMLSHWARDRKRGPKLPLSRVVELLTGANARHLGLRDRGFLRPGLRADLNLIDMDQLQLQRPHMVQDLPAGGQRLLQEAEGYVATFVRGEQIVDRGQLTGARPGRLCSRP